MWTTKTIKKKISGKTSEAMDSIFESMDGMFEKMNTIMNDTEIDEDDSEIETEGVFKVDSENGVICITANNGHIVIEGNLKSLRINGVNYDTIMTNPLKE